MEPVIVRNLRIGEGIPKICVPLVGATKGQILKEAEAVADIPADFVEWRADWFEGGMHIGQVRDVLHMLRLCLKEKPLLFTFRTASEGGEKHIGAKDYENLLKAAIVSGCVDLADVEVFMGDALVKGLVSTAHRAGVKIVASNHDFEKTPPKDEIIRRLVKIQGLGADISKIAVMPQDEKDVLTLLAATEEMQRQNTGGPVITMSMSGMGVISRLCGGVFGSAVTFGAAGKASAPGQLSVRELAGVLKLLHRAGCAPTG